jgi:succinyl-CoA synthetase beta subunit
MDPRSMIAEARQRGRGSLDEATGKALLAHYGIAVPRSVVIREADDVARLPREIRFPVAVKVVSSDILHKSDAGGVRVSLRTAADVQNAIREMAALPAIARARVDGWLIDEMAPPGQEVVIGALRDPHFGPLVMVGLGGIFVEVLSDVAFRICPITRVDAEEMLDELKGARVLEGARGREPASREAIVDVLLRMGGEAGLLMQHASDISEADINPLIVSSTGAVAVDARIILG